MKRFRLKKEKWVAVRGYRGRYEISTKGRVKSLRRKVQAGNGGVGIVPERILKPQLNGSGYYHFSLSKNGKTKSIKRATLVAEAFIPNPHDLIEVNHKDGVKTNDSIKNLEWVTHLENVRHAFATGLVKSRGDKRGEKNGRAILTEAIVRDVRKLAERGWSNSRIMSRYKMLSSSKVSKIKLRRQWSHI